jgi:transcription elongation factor Elf1
MEDRVMANEIVYCVRCGSKSIVSMEISSYDNEIILRVDCNACGWSGLISPNSKT